MTTIINAATSGGLIQTADTSGELQLQTASTAALTISATQNVGIGTASPGYALDVRSTSAPAIRLSRSGTAGQIASMVFEDGNATLGSGSTTRVASDAGAMSFSTGGTSGAVTGGTERMRIASTGEVGIGSTSTTYKLNIQNSSTTAFDGMQVAGDNASYNLVFQSGSVSASGTLFGVNKARGQFISSNNSPIAIGTLDGFPLVFGTSSTAAMRIDSAGNLLIGNTSGFTSKLSVTQTLTGERGISSVTPASYGSAAFRSLASATASTGWYHLFGTSSTDTVSDIIIYGNGNIQNTNNSYGAISDIKLKENIVDATPKLDKLMQVKVRNYNLKGGYEKHKQIGVIAQELETVFPGLIEETQDRGENDEILETTTKSVKYSVFVPMLIKAMQEQQALITDLTTRLAALEGAK